MSFTKGPWHYQEESDAYTHIVRGPNNEFILSAPQGTKGHDEANARLAAAAPAMYEALKELASALNICRLVMADKEARAEAGEMLSNARRIIASAEGRTA